MLPILDSLCTIKPSQGKLFSPARSSSGISPSWKWLVKTFWCQYCNTVLFCTEVSNIMPVLPWSLTQQPWPTWEVNCEHLDSCGTFIWCAFLCHPAEVALRSSYHTDLPWPPRVTPAPSASKELFLLFGINLTAPKTLMTFFSPLSPCTFQGIKTHLGFWKFFLESYRFQVEKKKKKKKFLFRKVYPHNSCQCYYVIFSASYLQQHKGKRYW